jgi:hypothetical protein
MILGVLSFLVVWHAFLTPHESTFYGMNQVFSITFSVGLIIQIAREMDDPFNGMWRVTLNDLNEEWRKDSKFTKGCPQD